MINSGTEKLQIQSLYGAVGMRTGTLMSRKVVEYFVVNELLRVAVCLRLKTHSGSPEV